MITQLLNVIRRESIVSAITCMGIGILFVAWPGSALVLLLRILALVLLVEGVICLVRFLKEDDMVRRKALSAPVLACLFVGILLLAAPRFVAGIFPVIIGLFLIFHGIKGIFTARHGSASVFGGIIGSVILLAVGLFLLIHPIGALKLLMVVVGIGLIYDGAVMLHLTNRFADGARRFREKHDRNIIDVDYKEE